MTIQESLGLPNRQVARDPLHVYPMALYFAKYVSWQQDVYKTVGHLAAAGFMQKWLSDPISLEARQPWKPLTYSTNKALDFEHIYFPLLWQFGGWGLAFLIFFIEIITKIFYERKKLTN